MRMIGEALHVHRSVNYATSDDVTAGAYSSGCDVEVVEHEEGRLVSEGHRADGPAYARTGALQNH